MGDTNSLLGLTPDQANNLTNFGFGMMSAGAQPGATTLGAAGQGGLYMNQAAQQNAQTQNMKQEGLGRTLNNAMTLRQLNLGNAAFNLPPVNMPGVPNLLQSSQTQQPSSSPSGATTGQPWAPSAGGNNPSQAPTRTQPVAPTNSGVSPVLQNLGVSQDVLDVALQKRAPQSRDEAIAAARVAGFLGNQEWGKELSSTAMKGMEPTDLRPGGARIDPLGGTTTVAPAHLQTVQGDTIPFAPPPVTYGNQSGGGFGGRNSGGGIQGNNQSGGVKTGFSPQEKATQDSYFGPETQAYNGAQGAMQNLELMQHSIDTLNSTPGFFSTGSAGTSRVAFGKAANTFLTGIGAEPIDQDQIAAGESLFKTTGRLGFNMSKQLGAREPGVITQQAIALNPGMDNTPQGVQLLKDSVQEEQQRIIDEHNFKGQFYAKNGFNQQAAESNFDSVYKPELYAKRATSQLDPITVNTPAGVKGLLAGTKIKTPKGIKIIPHGVGITPPTYSSIQHPQTPQQSQEETE